MEHASNGGASIGALPATVLHGLPDDIHSDRGEGVRGAQQACAEHSEDGEGGQYPPV
jgi:hypothetical protein